jgi:WD40 repeat protein
MPLLQKHDLGAQGSRITQLLQDVVETLQLYGFPIRSHALHTYHSAFVTMPSCLLLDTLDQQDVPDSHRLPNLVSSRTGHLGQAARVLMGHSSQVEAVSYSSDGTRIVSGARDKTIRVWSAISFEELGRMEGHRDWVNSVTFSPKGTWIVSGSDDYTVRIWRSVDLEHLATLEGHQGRVSSVAVSPDEKRIISGSHDKTVCVWCTSNFVQLGRLDGYESSIFSVAFSPQGDRIVFSCSKAVRVFDAVSLQCLVELEATIHRTPMTKGLFRPVALSHDGMHIFAGTSTGRVRVWCSVTFQELATFDQEQGSVDWLSISSDGAFVLSGDWVNGRIHVWNAQSFKEITRFHAHRWGVRSVAFSPDSTRFVSGGMDKALRVWVTDMFNYNAVESEAPRRQMRPLAFSADGAHILLRSQEASKQWPFEQDPELGRLSTVRVWNVNKFEELGQIERVSLFAFSSDGSRAVVHENEVSLSIWSLSPFEKVSDFNMPEGPGRIESIAYSLEGTRIVCGMPTGSIDFWSAVTFEKLYEFEGHGSSVLDVMFSADGTRLISRSLADGIRVWDAHTLENLGEIHVHEAALMCMAVSPQGTHVMAGLPDKTVRVWSTITSREILSLPLKDRFYKLNHTAFSPDGKSVLFVQYSCETQTWTRSETDSCVSSFPHPCVIHTDVNRIAVWTEAPLSAVQLPNDGTAGDLGILLSKSGWLSCWINSQPRLIWLPHDRRGDVFSSSGRRVAVVADTGDPTILHFPTGKR